MRSIEPKPYGWLVLDEGKILSEVACDLYLTAALRLWVDHARGSDAREDRLMRAEREELRPYGKRIVSVNRTGIVGGPIR